MAKLPTKSTDPVIDPTVDTSPPKAVTSEVTGDQTAAAEQPPPKPSGIVLSDAPIEPADIEQAPAATIEPKAAYMSPRTLAEMDVGKRSISHT
jgi:hypothetical protein